MLGMEYLLITFTSAAGGYLVSYLTPHIKVVEKEVQVIKEVPKEVIKEVIKEVKAVDGVVYLAEKEFNHLAYIMTKYLGNTLKTEAHYVNKITNDIIELDGTVFKKL
jgi:hypothetical protein